MSDIEEDEFDEQETENHEGEDEAEEKEKEAKILSEEIAGQSLSLLCKSGDGLSHAFVRLDLKQKDLSDISILQGYIHLRYVDISNNRVTDLESLNNLTHLLSLKADYNQLEKIALRPFPFLQHASFSFNKIMDTSGLQHPLLEHLNLNNNQIEDVKDLDGSLLTKLHTLEIKENKIKSLEHLNVPSLRNLYIGYNAINSLNGISRMNALETLYLRKNNIADLTGLEETISDLKYINLRENRIESIAEIMKLQCLPSLKILSLTDNPVCNEDDFRTEVLVTLLGLDKLNKDEFADEEKIEALEIYRQRQVEKEKSVELENMDSVV